MSTDTALIRILKKLHPNAPDTLLFWTDDFAKKGAPLRFVSKYFWPSQTTSESNASKLFPVFQSHGYQSYLAKLAKLNTELGTPVMIEGQTKQMSMSDWFQIEKSLTIEQLKALAGKGKSLLQYDRIAQKNKKESKWVPSLLTRYSPLSPLTAVFAALGVGATIATLISLLNMVCLRIIEVIKYSSTWNTEQFAEATVAHVQAVEAFHTGPTSVLACIGYLFSCFILIGLSDAISAAARDQYREKLAVQVSDTWEQVFQSEKLADLMLLGIIRELLDRCPVQDMPDFQSIAPSQAWVLVQECRLNAKERETTEQQDVPDAENAPAKDAPLTYAQWVDIYCTKNTAGPHEDAQALVSRSFQQNEMTASPVLNQP